MHFSIFAFPSISAFLPENRQQKVFSDKQFLFCQNTANPLFVVSDFSGFTPEIQRDEAFQETLQAFLRKIPRESLGILSGAG